VIAEARARNTALGLYLWLVVVTGVRRGELCGLQIRDIDLDRGLVHVAFNYVVRGGQRVRKDTKTHQDRWLAIDPDTCVLIASYLDETRAVLAAVGAGLRDDAYLFSNDPAHSRPWNPDWVTHQIAAAADAADVKLDIKGGRHYTASQLLAGSFDLRNTAARLGHSGGGATTLRHYADPVPEVDRRAAAYLAKLTARSAAQTDLRFTRCTNRAVGNSCLHAKAAKPTSCQLAWPREADGVEIQLKLQHNKSNYHSSETEDLSSRASLLLDPAPLTAVVTSLVPAL